MPLSLQYAAAGPTYRAAPVVPGSYADRFGSADPNGHGLVAPFLGDPSRYQGVPLDGKGATFVGVPDRSGNPFGIMILGPGRSHLYDWPSVRNRNLAGYLAARDLFHDIEAGMMSRLSLVADTSCFIGASRGPDPVQDPTPYGRFQSKSNFAPPADPNLHVYRRRVPNILPGDAEQRIVGSDDLGVARAPSTCARIYGVPMFIPPLKDGDKPVPFLATVNPWLRIGYITGFPGDIIGGDTWVASAIRTVIDIIIAVGAAYFGQFGFVLAALKDIFTTWYDFSQLAGAFAADANLIGEHVEAAAGGAAKGGAPKNAPGGPSQGQGATNDQTASLLVGAGLLALLAL